MPSIFNFQAPKWLNTENTEELPPEKLLERAREAASSFYAIGVQTGLHSMIEWCGVMGEYVRMLKSAYDCSGIDPESVNQHSGSAVKVEDYMVAYFCEKLGCQIKPFIRGDKATWRAEINKWFEEG